MPFDDMRCGDHHKSSYFYHFFANHSVTGMVWYFISDGMIGWWLGVDKSGSINRSCTTITEA